MSAALSRLADETGKLDLSEVSNLGVVAFAGSATRLLRRPVESFAEDAADVIVMERDAEVPLNEDGDASAGPQLGGPAVGFGSLQEELGEAFVLRGRQACGRSRMGLGYEAVGAFREFEPAVNGRVRRRVCGRPRRVVVPR